MFEGARGLLKSPRLLVTAAVGALLLAGAVIVWTLPVPDEPAPPADMRPALPQPSIAVLPFSLSGDEQPVANLSAGMTAELVRELARYSDRKSTRLNPVTNAQLVCHLLLAHK